MRKYMSLIGIYGLFLFFMLGTAFLYYGHGQGQSPVPLILTGIPTIIVTLIVAKALYEVHKHRNDEEPW